MMVFEKGWRTALVVAILKLAFSAGRNLGC